MDPTLIVAGVAFLMIASLAVIIGMLVSGPTENVENRLKDLRNSGTNSRQETEAVRSLARDKIRELGNVLAPKDEKERTALAGRMIQAGFYNPQAPMLFLGAKLIAMVAGPLLGVLLIVTGLLAPLWGLVICAVGGLIGFIGPSFWLDGRKKKRQTSIRRGLPDAMDVIIICMEGGLSLPAALQRVADELAVAHPMLAQELKICQKEIQLGKRTGEAIREFSMRVDMEEVRSLSGVIAQAEKYGASLAQALRIHAETMRERRAQKAEEMAHKAGTKIMFPTLLFIFPAIFLVIMGPAVMKIMRMMGNING